MNTSNRPLSEQYRLAGKDWVALDAAARILEEGKTTFLAQQKSAQGNDLTDAKAERLVKASETWADYIKSMVHARTKANDAKIEMEFARMRFMEWNNADATRRAEMRLAS